MKRCVVLAFLVASLVTTIGDVAHAPSIDDVHYRTLDEASPSTFNVVDYGAGANGTDASPAFLAAWEDACQSAVPATVYVPPGTYILSSLVFDGPCNSSSVAFVLAATLVAAPTTLGDLTSRWITFSGVHGLKVAGGVLNGNGTSVWDCKNNASNDGDCSQGGATVRRTVPVPCFFLIIAHSC
jgi:polygalacturonase